MFCILINKTSDRLTQTPGGTVGKEYVWHPKSQLLSREKLAFTLSSRLSLANWKALTWNHLTFFPTAWPRHLSSVKACQVPKGHLGNSKKRGPCHSFLHPQVPEAWQNLFRPWGRQRNNWFRIRSNCHQMSPKQLPSRSSTEVWTNEWMNEVHRVKRVADTLVGFS